MDILNFNLYCQLAVWKECSGLQPLARLPSILTNTEWIITHLTNNNSIWLSSTKFYKMIHKCFLEKSKPLSSTILRNRFS